MKRNRFVRQEPPNLAVAVGVGFEPTTQEFHFMASPCVLPIDTTQPFYDGNCFRRI